MPAMYCLNCFYDLRGQVEHRCPECGQAFSPDWPSTYSATPGPERFQTFVRQASKVLGEALVTMEPTEPNSRALSALRRQVGRLTADNWELQRQVAALSRLLLDRGVIDPAELAAAIEAFTAPDIAVVDDTSVTDAPASVDEDVFSPELMDLQRAVDEHAAGA